MAFTATQLANLRAAIASGSLEVRNGSNVVTYRSLDEMRQIEAMMATDLGETSVSQASTTARMSITAFTRD